MIKSAEIQQPNQFGHGGHHISEIIHSKGALNQKMKNDYSFQYASQSVIFGTIFEGASSILPVSKFKRYTEFAYSLNYEGRLISSRNCFITEI